jgi:hypothetical protein
LTVTPSWNDFYMPQQLVLIDPDEGRDADWRLDDETRAVGLRGIAEARRILAQASERAGQRSAA